VADPLILFTGVPKAGVTTRLAALRAALLQDHDFRVYEVNEHGKPIVSDKRFREFELLDILGRSDRANPGPSMAAGLGGPIWLGLEAGSHKDCVEIWEKSLHDAILAVERSDYEINGIVISLPIQSLLANEDARQLDALMRELRIKYWSNSVGRTVPWVFLDLTRYETLFAQLVPEMLPTIQVGGTPKPVTPLWLAARPEVQEMAIRSFCQGWFGDNELTHLSNAERQRCANPTQPRRVMIQVCTAWGFLAGTSGPAARAPANCERADASGGDRPHFPRFTEEERGVLTMLKLGHAVSSMLDGRQVADHVEAEARKFADIWKPLGIVEPIPSVAWNRPAPNMFWMPEVMSSGSGRV
jgi:hypothetical protein